MKKYENPEIKISNFSLEENILDSSVFDIPGAGKGDDTVGPEL